MHARILLAALAALTITTHANAGAPGSRAPVTSFCGDRVCGHVAEARQARGHRRHVARAAHLSAVKTAALIATPDVLPAIEGEALPAAGTDEFKAALSIAAADAKEYLVRTARPGNTMTRQGPAEAIGRLHPVFALRLAAAIKEARASGLSDVGLFSAYRPPAFGVGGFRNKYESAHSYGLAGDMKGIGSPGSAQAKKWNDIAVAHGLVNPYFGRRSIEWNHYQAMAMRIMPTRGALRASITSRGPTVLARMWEAADPFLGAAKATDLAAWRPKLTAIAVP